MCRDADWEEEEKEEEEEVSRNLSLGDPLVIRDNARPRDCDCRVRVSPLSQTFVLRVCDAIVAPSTQELHIECVATYSTSSELRTALYLYGKPATSEVVSARTSSQFTRNSLFPALYAPENCYRHRNASCMAISTQL